MKQAVFYCVVLCALCALVHGATIPSDIRTTVTFVYVQGRDGTPVPNGTGSFVGLLFAVVVQTLLILVVVNAARKRRGKCDWTLGQARKSIWLAAVGVVVGNLMPILTSAPPSSPIAIFSLALMLYSVFILAKALCRKADLRRSATHS